MVTKKTTKTSKAPVKRSKAVIKKSVKEPVAKATDKSAKKSTIKKSVQQEAPAERKSTARGKYIYAVGRRKTSTAKVRLYPGGGDILVNDKPFKEYFAWVPWQRRIVQPLSVVGGEKSFDVHVVVLGGGLSGQSEAIAHGLARALVQSDEGHKKVLKTHGLLTRDSRMKERKKPGLKKARRAPQWSKR